MSKETALVVCPGRGTYNAAELGYLQRWHDGGGDFVAMLDDLRKKEGQTDISSLDRAAKFSSRQHLTSDNASLLIYACALADFAAIDRDRFEIAAITGNSMGWYLALASADVLSLEDGAALVNNMGRLMHEKGVGGQIVWPLVDADWRIDPERQALCEQLLAEAADREDIAVHISIQLGGMLVFAADDAGLKWLAGKLPKDDRFPMRLNHHAAFHSPLLDHIVPEAQANNPMESFGGGRIPLIDGTGRIWSPKAFDPAGIYRYTLGHQINRSYDFSRAVQVAAAEFAPDRIIILGPGTTLGAPTAQALIDAGLNSFSGKAEFQKLQNDDPYLLSMGIEEQRKIACG